MTRMHTCKELGNLLPKSRCRQMPLVRNSFVSVDRKGFHKPSIHTANAFALFRIVSVICNAQTCIARMDRENPIYLSPPIKHMQTIRHTKHTKAPIPPVNAPNKDRAKQRMRDLPVYMFANIMLA